MTARLGLVLVFRICYIFYMLFISLVFGAVACIARCKSNARLYPIWSSGNYCRASANDCWSAYDFQGSGSKDPVCNVPWNDFATSSKFPLVLNYVEFSSDFKCNEYYKNALLEVTNQATSSNVESLQRAQCGCDDMIGALIEEGKDLVGYSSNFCDTVVNRILPTKRTCSKANGSLSKVVCREMLGIASDSVDKTILTPVCELVLRVLKSQTGVDIGRFYSSFSSNLDSKIIDISKAVCGILTCKNELPNACLPAVNGVMNSISKTYCEAQGLSSDGACLTYMSLFGVSLYQIVQF
eukprot:NODE_236_length_13376_cov_0.329367.p4 type:complete len:296 gc:universal NODE_236_length_13376_cov_0.329367:3597-2710(-)